MVDRETLVARGTTLEIENEKAMKSLFVHLPLHASVRGLESASRLPTSELVQ